MRKYIIIISFVFISLFTVIGIKAEKSDIEATQEIKIEKESTDTPKIIQNLKDKIATKVSELRSSNKRIIKGIIEAIEGDEVKITDPQKQNYNLTIDDLSDNLFKIDKLGKKTKIEKDDIKINSNVIAYGSLVENSLTLSKLYIYDVVSVFTGHIQKVNSDYSIDVVSKNGQSKIFDIESYTKQKIFDKQNMKFNESGFSKFKEGDYVIVDFQSTKDTSRSAALRVLLIPQESF